MVDKILKKHFAVNDSDTPVTLTQGRGHQTWYELVGPMQDYNNAKFKKPRWNDVREKATDKVFCEIKKHVSYLL